MVYFVVKHPHYYTVRGFLRTCGRAYARFVRVVSYESLFARTHVRPGVYVFCDIERLSPSQAELAADLWDAIVSHWGRQFVFNHPTVSFTRYELLRRLHAVGMNQHAVARADDYACGLKFPVFIRREDEHMGSDTALIGSQADLDNALLKLRREGACLRNRIIVEYSDTGDEEGVHNLCAVHRSGDQLHAGHLYFARDWEVKERNRLLSDEWMRKEKAFLQANPDRDYIKKVFDIAAIEYGRIDYSRIGDHLEVWEINTNPTHVSHQEPRCPIEAENLDMECKSFGESLHKLNTQWLASHGHSNAAIRWRHGDIYRLACQWHIRLRRIMAGLTTSICARCGRLSAGK